MAKKKDQDAQRKWEDRINRAKAVRKNWKDLFKVDMALEFFDGKQNPGYPAEEWITINKIYSHVKSQLPALYNADPYFYVKIRRSYSTDPMEIAIMEKKAKIRQSYLNYLKEELNLKTKVRLSVQDAFFAYGIAKVHYAADEQKNELAGMPITGEDGLPMTAEDGEILMEPEYIPINERYVIDRVHPDDFLWDEDAGPLADTWKWCAQQVRETLGEMKKNRMYNKAALKSIESKPGEDPEDKQKRDDRKKGGDIPGKAERESSSTKQRAEKDDEVITRWEIYDLKNKSWSVIVDGGDIPLINELPLPPGTESHPFAILRFTYRDDSPYPIPPVSQGIDPQKEYNLARSRILTHRKRFNRKYTAVISRLADEMELSKLENGDDGTIIKTIGDNAIAPIQDAALDQMGYMEVNMLNADLIELLGGATDEARGIAGAESATQAGILDKRLEMKEGDAMSMVIDFVKDIARKLDQLVQTHITRDEAVRIAGGPDGEFWQVVKQTDYEEINGEFSYDVNVGATIPRLPQMERASLTAILQLFASFPHLLTVPELVKEILTMHHIENDMLAHKLVELGQKIMQGQMPMPGNPGSQAGLGEDRPVSAVGGQAGGPLSLALPMAGNAQ